jgi:protoporphyrinogen oxidase
VTRTVGIVGGGILGLTVAHRLVSAGVRPVLFERSNDLGGLVGAFDLDGHRVDRFYHVILPNDDRVLGLMDDVGLAGKVRFRGTQVGFYDAGKLSSMNSLREFLTFPLLSPYERVRLAAFIARCQLISNSDRLDETPLVPWLRKKCGRRTTERLWLPLLDAKFDGQVDDLPATYIWSRTRRMSGARDKSGREVMGWIEGGYERLVDALADRIRSAGGSLNTGVAVDRIIPHAEGGATLVVDGTPRRFDTVLCTLTPPHRRHLFADGDLAQLPADRHRYLGVICLVVRTRQSISPYYTLNITDRSVGLTTIVETTHVTDPAHVGGHLLYITRYLDPSSDQLTAPDDDVTADFLARARRVFPRLTDDQIDAVSLQRARIVEPVHPIGVAGKRMDSFPLPGLALASTADVYPENVNGQAVIAIADEVAAGILARLAEPRREAA